MISETQFIDVFRVARHDWMNQLQLIKANLALNRLDRIEAIINKIVKDAQSESNLSNLKAPKLASLLILQKNTVNAIILHINVDPISIDLSELDDQITSNLETLFNAIQTSSEAGQSVHVELTLFKIEVSHLCIELTFPACVIKEDDFKKKVDPIEKGTYLKKELNETDKEEIQFTFLFPLKESD